jgi:hypothetical protein
MESVDWSCAETIVQHANASEIPRTERLSKFMDANLPVCERTKYGKGPD